MLGSPERGAVGADTKARLSGAMSRHESAGRRERGRARARGEILGARGSEAAEGTLIRRQSLLFAGRRRKRISADSSYGERTLQPSHRGGPATRVHERCEMRRGLRQRAEMSRNTCARTRASPLLTRSRPAPCDFGHTRAARRRRPRSTGTQRHGEAAVSLCSDEDRTLEGCARAS